MGRQRSEAARLEAALDVVERLDPEGLRTRWQELYGKPAPTTFRERLLRAGVAYKLQERVLGGLRPGTRTLLGRVAAQAEHQRKGGGSAAREPGTADEHRTAATGPVVAVRRRPTTRIKPGTRLLRTWQGTTHEVVVGEDEVTYRGQRYRSLSEVARLITGQRWSGPLFFGLRRRHQDKGA